MGSNSATKPLSQQSFIQFLLSKDRLLEFVVFTSLAVGLMFLFFDAYPYPIITGDSGNYVLRAREGSIGAYRPYGYSVFLAKLHSISADVRVIFFGQYILSFLSSMFFLFTVQFLFRLRKPLFYLLGLAVVASPTVLYVSTLVMSDSLFYALSLLYLSSGLWFIRLDNKWWIVLLHLLLLYVILYTRYVALIYPFVSIVALLWGSVSWKRFAWAVTPLLVTFMFYNGVKDRMEEVFGMEIFSGFGGWAMANNAVSIVPYIDLKLSDIKDPNVKYVHSFVIQQPDSIYADKEFINGTHFMWGKEMPPKRMLQDYKKKRPTTYAKLWLLSGQMLGEYGIYLIKHYPFQYFKHFVIPNTMYLFQTFRIEEWEEFKPLGLEYFEYPVDTYKYEKPLISRVYPFRVAVTSALWILGLGAIIYLVVKRKALKPEYVAGLVFCLVFVLAHCFMSVIAHPINNFRYLMPIYPLLLIIVLFTVNSILESRKGLKEKA